MSADDGHLVISGKILFCIVTMHQLRDYGLTGDMVGSFCHLLSAVVGHKACWLVSRQLGL
jgi:hypothetical protein